MPEAVRSGNDWISALGHSGASVLTDAADCWTYGYDNSRLHATPAAVALVTSHEQVMAIVKICNRARIPITARGRGTGTTGAAVPERGGLVVSFERMRDILEIDPGSRILRAQTGALNQEIQDYCKTYGFFWAPDPGSAEFCTLGGNIACNAAGPRAIKYGTARENTLGLKAVSGSGNEIITGTRTTKGVVGLDLTRLLIGSEGTLALITEATLKLTPLPTHYRTMCASYDRLEAAAGAVAAIAAQPMTPCALEIMDQTSLQLLREQSGLNLPQRAQAMLLIEADGDGKTVEAASQSIRNAALNDGMLSFDTAANAHEASTLRNARKQLSPALRKIAAGKINEDIVVPVSKIAPFIRSVEALARQYRLTIATFGHAGNGNLHVNILFDPAAEKQARAAHQCLHEMLNATLAFGGTLSGEHGIGLTKRDYISSEIPAHSLQIMHSITRLFDPNDILNPGKSLPRQAAL